MAAERPWPPWIVGMPSAQSAACLYGEDMDNLCRLQGSADCLTCRGVSVTSEQAMQPVSPHSCFIQAANQAQDMARSARQEKMALALQSISAVNAAILTGMAAAQLSRDARRVLRPGICQMRSWCGPASSGTLLYDDVSHQPPPNSQGSMVTHGLWPQAVLPSARYWVLPCRGGNGPVGGLPLVTGLA
jgi:hypothetical protein